MTDYTVEVDRATSTTWAEWIDLFEDANIYQTWSYGAVRWGERSLSHLVLKRAGQVMAIAQLRILQSRKLKCGIAYLRWGPLCERRGTECEPESVQKMAVALYDEYVCKRGLFLRILPNAFAGTPRAMRFETAFSQYGAESFGATDSFRTSVLDLEPPLEILRKNLDQKWRNQLNRAERNGLKVTEGDGASDFQAFIRIYDEMCARKQFDRSSDIREFERIQEKLPKEHRMRILLCEHEGVSAAGLVGTAMGNSGIYLFGATTDHGMKSKGAYLLQWLMIQRLKGDGVRYYNLGGINPLRNPGVYHFKQGLSGQELNYLSPMVSCNSFKSKAFAKVATLSRGKIRGALNKLLRR